MKTVRKNAAAKALNERKSGFIKEFYDETDSQGNIQRYEIKDPDETQYMIIVDKPEVEGFVNVFDFDEHSIDIQAMVEGATERSATDSFIK